MCIEGALAAALDFESADLEGRHADRALLAECPVYGAIVDTVNEVYYDGDYLIDDGELPGWNDNDERTEQEVLDVLHLTAKRVMGVEV